LWTEWRWDRLFLSTNADGSAYRWIDAHDVWTNIGVLSADASLLATSGTDNYTYACPEAASCSLVVATTRVWEAATFKRVGQLPVGFDQLALTPDNAILLGINRRGLEAWDWRTGQQLWVSNHANARVSLAGLRISPDGQYAAAYSRFARQSVVQLWRMDTGALVASLPGHTQPTRLSLSQGVRWPFGVHITGLAFSPDSTRLAASSLDGTVIIWPLP
jgi:WD40 repeat protein